MEAIMKARIRKNFDSIDFIYQFHQPIRQQVKTSSYIFWKTICVELILVWNFLPIIPIVCNRTNTHLGFAVEASYYEPADVEVSFLSMLR